MHSVAPVARHRVHYTRQTPPQSMLTREKATRKMQISRKTVKKHRDKFVYPKISSTFALANHKGTLAEWLGNGLQNRVRRFESARYLRRVVRNLTTLFLFPHPIYSPYTTHCHASRHFVSTSLLIDIFGTPFATYYSGTLFHIKLRIKN